jgi:hypothetical protein
MNLVNIYFIEYILAIILENVVFLPGFGISPNVSKYMTFGAGNRAMRSIDPCPKCGVDKTAQRALPDCGFAEPKPPTGGEAYTVCYVPFVGNMPNYIVRHIDNKMKKAQWFLQENDRENID